MLSNLSGTMAGCVHKHTQHTYPNSVSNGFAIAKKEGKIEFEVKLYFCIMTDVHNKQQRSYNMSRIKGKDTKPEMLVRKFLHANGYRYKLHDKKLYL